MTYDAAIVGAGIVGAACAAALSHEGLSVVLIDKNAPATGTTAAGMGHIVVMDDSEAQFDLTSYSQKLWRKLADEMPPTCEYETCGTIWIAADDDEMNEVRRKHEFYTDRGITAQILDKTALHEAEPNLADDLVGGLLIESDAVVYQLTATRYLIDKALANGAVIQSGRVVEFGTSGVKLENGDVINAAKIVNAAGAGAADLTPQLHIKKRKGHLVITERYSGFIRHQLVELGYLKSAHGSEAGSVAFNVQPRSTGQVLLGSSRQFDAPTDGIDNEILSRMTARAFRYMPGLRDLATVRVWTGFRPATPDNLPYIGKIPGLKNVYATAGHEGLGITTSLGTAQLLADEIMERKSAISPEPYRPDRHIDNA